MISCVSSAKASSAMRRSATCAPSASKSMIFDSQTCSIIHPSSGVALNSSQANRSSIVQVGAEEGIEEGDQQRQVHYLQQKAEAAGHRMPVRLFLLQQPQIALGPQLRLRPQECGQAALIKRGGESAKRQDRIDLIVSNLIYVITMIAVIISRANHVLKTRHPRLPL